MDASGSSSGAHATTWPHAQMTSSNIAEVGTNWFRQLRTLMNNYLDGSSNHVFGVKARLNLTENEDHYLNGAPSIDGVHLQLDPGNVNRANSA